MEAELLLVLLTALGTLVTIIVSASQAWGMHLARARARDEKFDADAAAAVAAVNANYVAPIRRAKLAGCFERAPPTPAAPEAPPQPPDTGLPPRGASVGTGAPLALLETRALAGLYATWALALELTPGESKTAHDRAYSALRERYPRAAEAEVRGRLDKAHKLAKQGMPSTLYNVAEFISKTRAPGQAVVV